MFIKFRYPLHGWIIKHVFFLFFPQNQNQQWRKDPARQVLSPQTEQHEIHVELENSGVKTVLYLVNKTSSDSLIFVSFWMKLGKITGILADNFVSISVVRVTNTN